MMKTIFLDIANTDIMKYVDLEEHDNHTNEVWTDVANIHLTSQEEQFLQKLQHHLMNIAVHLMNEATIWGRAIYPLLLLAENKNIQTWAEVALLANYKNFILEGTADGVFATSVSGHLKPPYLIIIASKRGIKAKDPVPQLYAALLAAVMLNQQQKSQQSQRIFGCYTIVDTWVFVQADVFSIEEKRPLLKIQTSREYNEKYEAIMLLKIIKNMLKASS